MASSIRGLTRLRVVTGNPSVDPHEAAVEESPVKDVIVSPASASCWRALPRRVRRAIAARRPLSSAMIAGVVTSYDRHFVNPSKPPRRK